MRLTSLQPPLFNGHSRFPATTPGLNCNNLFVECTRFHPELLPSVKVIPGGDSSACALGLTDRPLLREGWGAYNGRFIDTLALVDTVCSSVACQGAFVCASTRRIVAIPGFDDVILDQRISEPTVDAKVAVAVWAVIGGVSNVPGTQISLSEPIQMEICKTGSLLKVFLTGNFLGSILFQRRSRHYHPKRRCMSHHVRWYI